MTGFTKLCKNDPSLKEKVAPILSNFSTYWDEDVQQRAIEYEFILKEAEQDESIKQVFDNAFEELPTFPESK